MGNIRTFIKKSIWYLNRNTYLIFTLFLNVTDKNKKINKRLIRHDSHLNPYEIIHSN